MKEEHRTNEMVQLVMTETVELADTHIIIFAARRIDRGEELSYDYKVSDRVPAFTGLTSFSIIPV